MYRLRSTLAVSVFSIVAHASPVLADGYGGSVKDDPVAPFSWTGIYLGANAGLATGDTEGRPETLSIAGGPPIAIPPIIANFFSTDYDLSGATYGGHVGYNHQIGSVVLGIEGSYSGGDIQGDGPAGLGFIVSEREIDWLATVTGRVGYAMGRSLLYGRAGVAWGDVSSSVRLGGITILEGEETHVGWTVGAGFEHAFSDHLTVRVEYAHIDLGSEDHDISYNGALGGPANLFSIGSDVEVTLDTLSIGASYKF